MIAISVFCVISAQFDLASSHHCLSASECPFRAYFHYRCAFRCMASDSH